VTPGLKTRPTTLRLTWRRVWRPGLLHCVWRPGLHRR